MTNEGIHVKLYLLISETWMERAAALEEEGPGNRERERGEAGGAEESWDTVAAGATEKEKDQKLGESPISSEKCLSQETGEPLGPMSHRERL